MGELHPLYLELVHEQLNVRLELRATLDTLVLVETRPKFPRAQSKAYGNLLS